MYTESQLKQAKLASNKNMSSDQKDTMIRDLTSEITQLRQNDLAS